MGMDNNAPTRSQVQAIGGPPPKTWDDYEAGCLATFGGGYRHGPDAAIFRHGMSTVFNLLRAEFPDPAETARLRATVSDVAAAIRAGNLMNYVPPTPGDDGTVSLAEVVAAAAAEIERRRQLYLDEVRRGTQVIESVTKLGAQCERLIDETDRLRSALMMIAQVRHVGGSAQAAFRSNLRLADAVLAGADVRDVETVERIAAGTWVPKSK